MALSLEYLHTLSSIIASCSLLSVPSRTVAPGQSIQKKVTRPLRLAFPYLPKPSCHCSDPVGRACPALSSITLSWVTQTSWRCRCSARSYRVPSCLWARPVMEELRELSSCDAPSAVKRYLASCREPSSLSVYPMRIARAASGRPVPSPLSPELVLESLGSRVWAESASG
ncbi:hypothetical protein FJTKL_05052 [Diaporthe vaccinii]|uniref:Secreted protein n=1 Tax=Diaporthe vaccinii TaxID=105482 RepID=A0ABR4EZI3_9PEZI